MALKQIPGIQVLSKYVLSLFAVGAIDLQGIYEQALSASETLKIQEQTLIQRREDLSQARGSLLPSVRYSYRWFTQDVPPGNSTFSSLRQEDQYTSQLNFTQPLFRGMAEYAALDATDLNYEAAKFAYKSEKLDLYESVASLFYQYLKAEAEIKNLSELLKNIKDRVGELGRRSRIGRSDTADLLSARSQATLAETELMLAQTSLNSARENLLVAVPNLEFTDLKDKLSLPKELPLLKEFLDKIETRPDIKQAQLLEESAGEQVGIARAGHFPSLDLEGNYYFIRPGVLQDVEWDIGLVLSFPLFEGGRVNSAVRKAASVKVQQELAFERLKRQAEADIKVLYEYYRTQKQRLNLLETTIKLSRDNYQSQQRNYRQGLRSYLEVIQFEREYWDIQRTLDNTLYETKLAWVRLMRAVGAKPGEQL